MIELAANPTVYGLAFSHHQIGTSAQPLSASGTHLALSFVAKRASIDGVIVICSAVAGTAANNSVIAELRADVASSTERIPDSTVIDSVIVTDWTGKTMMPVEFLKNITGLTVGARYWWVFRNVAASPTVDYPTLRWATPGNGGWVSYQGQDSHRNYGTAKRHSTDGGATWAAGNVDATWGYGIKYGDEYDGLIAYGQTSVGDADDKFYTGIKLGGEYQSPDCWLSVYGVQCSVNRSGAMTGGEATAELYINGALVATSLPKVVDGTSSYNIWMFHFPDEVRIPPNSTYRVMLAYSAGTSSNYFQLRCLDMKVDTYRSCLGLGANPRRVKDVSGTLTYSTIYVPTIALMCSRSQPSPPPPFNRRNAMR